MKKLIFCLSVAFTLCPFSYGQGAGQRGTTAIWLSGVAPVVQLRKRTQTPADYMDLFRSDARWTRAASGLKVFEIGGER
jgi:hypothetical protein